MHWVRERDSFPAGMPGDADSHYAARPWVLEDPEGGLRMWYSGNDGTTSRILSAVRAPGQAWQRLGPCVGPGLAGDTDEFGVEAPSVVRTPGGYLMAYGGFDGDVTRLHMAASEDGERWDPLGTVLQRGEEDQLGATHPCLLQTGERWWLFYTGFGAAGRGGSILAAVSNTGASWDRVGCVLEPSPDEFGASAPCVTDIEREFQMFYASGPGDKMTIALATSPNGASWNRRGAVLSPSEDGPDSGSVDTPCVVRFTDGSTHMWYSAGLKGDTENVRQICSARFCSPEHPRGHPRVTG
jgi:predicted GH43/DUF377 family glycosyl hydrolase